MELFLPHGPLGGRVASIASKSQLQRLLPWARGLKGMI